MNIYSSFNLIKENSFKILNNKNKLLFSINLNQGKYNLFKTTQTFYLRSNSLNDMDDLELERYLNLQNSISFNEKEYYILIKDYFYTKFDNNKFPYKYNLQTIFLDNMIDIRFFPLYKF